MIKLLCSFVVICSVVYAKTDEPKVSTFTLKDGKKIYHPIQNEVIKQTIKNEVVKSTIKRPVFKAVSVDYNASN